MKSVGGQVWGRQQSRYPQTPDPLASAMAFRSSGFYPLSPLPLSPPQGTERRRVYLSFWMKCG